MIEILPSPDHVAAFRISDELTGPDYDRIIRELESRLARNTRVAVYADLTQFKRMNLEALRKDLQYFIAKRNDLHRFLRLAIVSDKSWPRVLSRIGQTWLPFEIRSFTGAERENAIAWTAEPPRASRPESLRLIRTSRSDTYGIVWNGKITRADVEHVLGVLRGELESHISVRMLVRVEKMGGFEPTALFQTALVRAKFLGIRKVERYAIAGGPAWLDRYAAVMGRITGIEMRHFPASKENDAWAWLEARPLQESDSPQLRATGASSVN